MIIHLPNKKMALDEKSIICLKVLQTAIKETCRMIYV